MILYTPMFISYYLLVADKAWDMLYYMIQECEYKVWKYDKFSVNKLIGYMVDRIHKDEVIYT